MENSAHTSQKVHILVTDVCSYLGVELAKSFLSQNCAVYGIAKEHAPAGLLSKSDFTLLEIDLSQPLPSHLPEFNLVFHPVSGNIIDAGTSLGGRPYLSPASLNIISLAKEGKSKVFLIAPIALSQEYYEHLAKEEKTKKFLSLFLIGDLYGPGMPLNSHFPKNHEATSGQLLTENELSDLISQAAETDKVILEKEGLKMIYPTYITDAIFAINKFVFSPQAKNIHFVISEDPKTSLSVAYEIQKTIRMVAQKEIGLFFGGPAQIHHQAEPIVKIHELGYLPKVLLAEGLKNTFEYLQGQKLIQDVQGNQPIEHFEPPSQETPPPPRLPIEKHHHVPKTSLFAKFGRRHITAPVPTIFLKPRLKIAVFAILLLFILTFAKTFFDIYLGYTGLKNAGYSIFAGDFKKAQSKSTSSAASFKAAQNKTKILLYPLAFIFPKKVEAINLSLAAAAKGGSSLSYFAEGSQILAHDLSIITAKSGTTEGLDLENPQADFKKAYLESTQAFEMAKAAKENGIFKNKLEQAQNSFLDLSRFSSSAMELVSLADDLISPTDKKTYLILLQNNTELRPGGGFIGNFGLIEFENGKLKNISVEDIYTIDGQLKEKIEPPSQLKEKLGIDRFYLRDSNWAPDFVLNATTARDFYRKETAKTVDGVISIDLVFIQNFLSKIGPLKLDDYKEEITAQNLFEKGEYYSEIGFFPGSTQKRDFFGALSRALITKILNSLPESGKLPEKQSPWLALIETAKDGLAAKHIMLTFDNPNLSSFVKTKGWDNPMPPSNFNPADDSTETRDFLALSEANLGANKVNRFLERKINYEMTIGRDADLAAKLKITYTNTSQAKTWPGGTYVNFLRVYLPPQAGLVEYKNGDKVDTKNVQVSNQANLTTLSTFVEVQPKETREIIFSYKIPKNIKLEQTPIYHLYVQKQPGTDKDPLTFTFNLPGYLAVKSVNGSDKEQGKQNLTVQTDLITDRQFEIELIRK